MQATANKVFGATQVRAINREYNDFTVYANDTDLYFDTFAPAWNKACNAADKGKDVFITMTNKKDQDMTRIDVYADWYSW